MEKVILQITDFNFRGKTKEGVYNLENWILKMELNLEPVDIYIKLYSVILSYSTSLNEHKRI